jgi:hypothetical protein
MLAVAYQPTFWDVVAWIFIFMLGVAILGAVIYAFIDNFERKDHGGWAKAGWAVLILFFPIFGLILYIAARPSNA